MIYTDLTKRAMQIAYDAHTGQVDRGGTPYIFHPLHVADQMEDEETAAVALLHDVLEDTQMTEEILREKGIPEEVIRAVKILTRDRSLPYSTYIDSVIASGDPLALRVKYADVCHNLDTTRTMNGRLPQRLYDRYTVARARLEEVLKNTQEVL